MNSNFILQFMSIFLLKIPVNKQWKLWTHLIMSASIDFEIVYPSGLSYSKTTQVWVFSRKLEEWLSASQGRGPVYCKKKKAVPPSNEWKSLNLKHCNLTAFFILDIQGSKLVFPKHTFVRKELFQLLTWVNDKWVLVQISINIVKELAICI
jgi:hypothetical protein